MLPAEVSQEAADKRNFRFGGRNLKRFRRGATRDGVAQTTQNLSDLCTESCLFSTAHKLIKR